MNEKVETIAGQEHLSDADEPETAHVDLPDIPPDLDRRPKAKQSADLAGEADQDGRADVADDFREDDEFKKICPPLSVAELAKLEASILFHGCRDPLVVWNGLLIDGYHRYFICRTSNLPFSTIEIELPDRDAAIRWIVDHALGRRNLTDFAKYELFKVWSDTLCRSGHERQLTGMSADGSAGGAGRKKNLPQNLGEGSKEDRHSRESGSVMAHEIGVSHEQVRRMRHIDEHADEADKGKLRAGSVTVNKVYTAIKKRQTPAEVRNPEDQKFAMVERLLAKESPAFLRRVHDLLVELGLEDAGAEGN